MPSSAPLPSTESSSHVASVWWTLMAVLLPAALYLATLYPGIGDRAASGDAVEFQLVGRALSIPHEPGYPQYVLLSFLWSWVPLPLTVATKINLLSAIFAVLGGGFFFATARSLCGSAAASMLACWVLLTASDLWLLATQAEVYTLHFLWVSVVLWAALRWQRSGSRRDLLVLLFAYGLSFGNHLTMITLLPALGLLLVTRQPRLVVDRTAWGWAALAALVGAAQYLLLVWRSYFPHPALLERFPLRGGAAQILAYITGNRFVEKHWLPLGLGEWAARLGEALAHGVSQLTPLLAVLGLYGLASGWRRQPSRTAFLLLAALSVVLFAVAYDIRDWRLYCIPAWVAIALLAADGTARLMRRLPRIGLLIALALGLILAPRIVGGVERLRVTGNAADLTHVLPHLPADARVLPAGGERLTRLHGAYYRYAEGLELSDGLRFISVRQDALRKGLFLRRRQFFFRSPTVAKILGGRLIDYHPWNAYRGPGSPVFVTGTDAPLSTVGLAALPGSALELTVRDAKRVLDGEKDFFLFFIGTRDGRAKGLEAFSVERQGDLARARRLLRQVTELDLVVLLVPQARESTHQPIAGLLASQGIDAPERASGRFVLVWRRGAVEGAPRSVRLWQPSADHQALELVLADL